MSSTTIRTMLVSYINLFSHTLHRELVADMKEKCISASTFQEDRRLELQEATVAYKGAVSKRLTTEKIYVDMMKYADFTLKKVRGWTCFLTTKPCDDDGDDDEYTNLCLSASCSFYSYTLRLLLPSPSFSFLPYLTMPLL